MRGRSLRTKTTQVTDGAPAKSNIPSYKDLS
jgi:hypothetical protein